MIIPQEISANGRNWYFTAALENEGYVVKPDISQFKKRVYLTKMMDAFQVMTIRLCPIKSRDVIKCAVFYFTDLGEYFQIQASHSGLSRDSTQIKMIK